MHHFLRKSNLAEITEKVYAKLPEQVMVPAEAYRLLVRGSVKHRAIKELEGKVSAVMVVPYPPGIPVIMPGERFSRETQKIIDYLVLCEEFDNRFPGFENEVHGVFIKEEKGRKNYYINCIR